MEIVKELTYEKDVEEIKNFIIKCWFQMQSSAKCLTTGKDVEEIETLIIKYFFRC